MSIIIKEQAILRMARFKVATVTGVSELLVKIPGTAGSGDGRYVEGGRGWFETHNLDDCFTVCITDEDNIMGYGAGVMVGSYTEQEIATINEGWYIPVGSKEVIVNAMAGMGWIPSGLYLKITATKGDLSADNFRMNLNWGVNDVG